MPAQQSLDRGEVGAAVPFIGDRLCGTRVRADSKHLLVAILPDFSGGSGSYVFPWTLLPSSVPMEKHDSALHTIIWRRKAVEPPAILRAAQEVARSGAAGPILQKHEGERVLKESKRRTALSNTLLGRALRGLGLSFDELAAAGVARTLGACFEEACRPHKLEFRQLTDVLDECVSLVTPLGLPQPDTILPGPARVLLDELVRLARHLNREVAQSTDPAGTDASLVLLNRAVEQTIDSAQEAIDQVDLRLDNLIATICAWSALRGEIADSIAEVLRLLDGWEDVLLQYTNTERGSKQTRIARAAALVATFHLGSSALH